MVSVLNWRCLMKYSDHEAHTLVVNLAYPLLSCKSILMKSSTTGIVGNSLAHQWTKQDFLKILFLQNSPNSRMGPVYLQSGNGNRVETFVESSFTLVVYYPTLWSQAWRHTVSFIMMISKVDLIFPYYFWLSIGEQFWWTVFPIQSLHNKKLKLSKYLFSNH